MTTKQLGNIGEAKTLAKFVELMIPVYVPFGDNEKSDLIAEFNGRLNRIQVKTSEKWEDGKIVINLVSSTAHRKAGVKHKYNKSEIDYFVIYNLQSDKLLLLPIEKFSERTSLTFRIPYQPSKNQHESFNWEDYLFEKIICVETLHETSSLEDEDKVQTTTEETLA